MMEELRIEKRKVEVEVVGLDGIHHRVRVFLGEFSAEHSGQERVADLLNGADQFFPAEEIASGLIFMLRRSNIVFARVALKDEPIAIEDGRHPNEATLVVSLADGSHMTANARYIRPPERSRVIDMLNGPERFFVVRKGETAVFINKEQVIAVKVGDFKQL
jgi:hypothetical protein